MCIVRERRPAGFLDMKCQTCCLKPKNLETDITCDSVTSFGGQLRQKHEVFTEAEDSSEGLVN